jgi:large subunit ribosomal protein L10
MVKQYKVDAVEVLTKQLGEKKNFILTNYSGIKVSALTKLRTDVKKKGATYKVVKNNLFRKALKDAGFPIIDDSLKGPIGVAFAGEQISEVAKVFKDFQKEQDKFSFSAGVIDGVFYGADALKRIADLPSKEALLSQIMSLINGPTAKIAIGTNQIMASLARGINAVAEKNGN